MSAFVALPQIASVVDSLLQSVIWRSFLFGGGGRSQAIPGLPAGCVKRFVERSVRPERRRCRKPAQRTTVTQGALERTIHSMERTNFWCAKAHPTSSASHSRCRGSCHCNLAFRSLTNRLPRRPPVPQSGTGRTPRNDGGTNASPFRCHSEGGGSRPKNLCGAATSPWQEPVGVANTSPHSQRRDSSSLPPAERDGRARNDTKRPRCRDHNVEILPRPAIFTPLPFALPFGSVRSFSVCSVARWRIRVVAVRRVFLRVPVRRLPFALPFGSVPSFSFSAFLCRAAYPCRSSCPSWSICLSPCLSVPSRRSPCALWLGGEFVSLPFAAPVLALHSFSEGGLLCGELPARRHLSPRAIFRKVVVRARRRLPRRF